MIIISTLNTTGVDMKSRKSALFTIYIICSLISSFHSAHAKPSLLLTMPPLLAASYSMDHIAGCYSGNFTDNCSGININGIIGVTINDNRSFSTVSIFGGQSSGKFIERENNTYTGSGQTDATGCGPYDISCTDLGYSISCNYKYANGKTGTISNANAASCMPAEKFFIQNLAGGWSFTGQSSHDYYFNINNVIENPPGSGNYNIKGYGKTGDQVSVSYISGNTYPFHLTQYCFRYCPWFEFNFISTNNIEGRYCEGYPDITCHPFSGNRFSSTVSTLAAARSDHTATMLADGRVLVTGGVGDTWHLASAELYDPATKGWYNASSFVTGRRNHTAILLTNGRVLIAGGYGNTGYLDATDQYDSAANTWSAVGNLITGRAYHTASLLPDGRVLVTGGIGDTGGYLASAELYNPNTRSWSVASTLAAPRYNHTATLLPDGRVIVAGGRNSSGSLNSTELYDPATNTWTTANSLSVAREGHTATLLPDGQVLVAGGRDSAEITLNSAERYDPAANSWAAVGNLSLSRYGHTATLLPDGRVLATAGDGSTGYYSAEIFDPATNSWSAAGTLNAGRHNHTATLLPDNHVLVTGGEGGMGGYIAITELYDPAYDYWSIPPGL